ncbi:MAG: lipopolysaccharide transport system permease protein [Thermoplasmata archaeon]|nr:lipopolysaccharide transport system permease protein [Thermoplasmata archaeon]
MTTVLGIPRQLLWNLVLREVRLSHRRMGLGILWTFINPLALILIYFLAFRYVLGVQPTPEYGLFLTLGILHWDLFNRIVTRAPESIVANGSLIDKVAFPRIVLPASVAVSELVQHGFVLAAFVFFYYPLGGKLWAGVALYPVILLLGWMFCLGLAMLLAALTVFARDLIHVVAIMMRVGFFLTPVIYDFTRVAEPWQTILALNPFAGYLEGIRSVLYRQSYPSLATWALMVFAAAATLALGKWVFERTQRRFTEFL